MTLQAANFITAGAVDGVLSVGCFGRADPAAGNLDIVKFPKEIRRLVRPRQFASWNRIAVWLRSIEAVRAAA